MVSHSAINVLVVVLVVGLNYHQRITGKNKGLLPH